MTFNALEALSQAGIVTDSTSAPTADVLRGLTEDEATFLSTLNDRMKAAIAPEVISHIEDGDEDIPDPCWVIFICDSFKKPN
jgi:hypothetical protein